MKNKKIIGFISIIGLFIVLIVIVVLIGFKKEELNDNKMQNDMPNAAESNDGNNTKNEEISKEDNIISCILENTDNEYYRVNEIIEITLEEKKIQSISSIEQIIYNDKDNYDGFKINEKVENATFDDENLTILISNPVELSEEEKKIDYEDLIKTYEEQGYKCQ